MATSFRKTKAARGNRGEWSAILLKARDISAVQGSVSVTVKGVQPAPASFTGGAMFILAIEPIGPRTCMALNYSNAEAIAAAVGDDLDAVIGKTLVFRRESCLLAGTGMVPTLVFDSILPEGKSAKK